MASVQDMVRPGDALDIVYYDSATSKKAAWATTQNTKYVQELSNKAGGSSVFIFPPQCGLQDICVSMTFAGISGTIPNIALPSGWAYSAVKTVSWRYAGTSQFTMTGAQLLQNALRAQTSRTSCDDLINLGGNYATGNVLAQPQTGSIVLRLPHNNGSGVNKSHPFPTDCLTQSVQVILELNPVASLWTNPAQVTLPLECTLLSSAFFQAQQVMFNNMGDSLARRADLSVKAYAFPCEFVQQEVSIDLNNNQSTHSVALTGFRAGECTSIQLYLVNKDDLQTNSSTGSQNGYNPNRWYPPSSVECVYAGDIYARYNNGVGQLFNLINSNKSPAFDIAVVNASKPIIPSAYLSQWLELPFAQALCDEDAHYILVHGKAITNGQVQLNNLVVPSVNSTNGWVLKISYVYNATILFSQGSCDYVF